MKSDNIQKLINKLGLVEGDHFLPPELYKLKKMKSFDCEFVWKRLVEIKAVDYDLEEFIYRLDFHYDFELDENGKDFKFIMDCYEKEVIDYRKKKEDSGLPPFNQIKNKPPSWYINQIKDENR